MALVKKFILITEEEYREFIKLQKPTSRINQTRINTTSSYKTSFNGAKRSNWYIIFANAIPPSKQEQRFNELTHLVKQLQAKVFAQTTLPSQPIKLPVATEA